MVLVVLVVVLIVVLVLVVVLLIVVHSDLTRPKNGYLTKNMLYQKI